MLMLTILFITMNLVSIAMVLECKLTHLRAVLSLLLFLGSYVLLYFNLTWGSNWN